jgi:hypothetical protein
VPVEGDATGPTAAEEILEEWQAVERLGRRLNDPLWQLKPQFALGEPDTGLSRSDADMALSDEEVVAEEEPPTRRGGPPPEMSEEDTSDRTDHYRRLSPRFWELAGAFYAQTLRPLLRAAYRRAWGIRYYSGAEIVAAVAGNTAHRVRSLMAVERALPTEADYGVVIAPACVCLELILGELLRPMNRTRAKSLSRALDGAGRSRQAELLRKWADGGLPMTMGLQVTLLAALEKAEATLQDLVAADLQTSHQYLGLVRSGRLAALLERVRTEYRNPACHGTRTFDRSEYTALARLLLTRDRFRAWYRRGPAELDAGLLDLHLLEWRQRRARLW